MRSKKLLAIGSTLLLVAGLFTLGTSAASAHQGSITASAACNTSTGMYDVTYTLSWSDVPSGVTAALSTRTGENSFQNGWGYSTWSDWTNRGTTTGASGSIHWTEQLPGSTAGNGPWVYAYTNWSNGYNQNEKHDTRIEGLAGNCGDTTSTMMYICHANNGVGTGGWNYQDVSIESIVNNNGHAEHQNKRDIIPPFSYKKGGVTLSFLGLNWNPTGQAIFNNGCDVPTPKDATATATVTTQPDCGVGGAVRFDLVNASWDNSSDVTDGSRTATATTGHLFANGTNKITVTYTPLAALSATSPACTVTPGTPDVVQSAYICNTNGTGNGSQATVTLSSSDRYTWTMTKNGGSSSAVSGTVNVTPGNYVFTATAKSGYSIASGASIFPVVINEPTVTPCLIVVTPVKPYVASNDQCGTVNDTLTVQDSMEGIKYTVTWNEAHTVATVTATSSDPAKYVIAANATTSWAFTFTDEPCIATVDVAPFAADQTCTPAATFARPSGVSTLSAPGYVEHDGGITVALDANLEYTITGGTLGSPLVVTTEFTALDPGDYIVTVKALNGYVLAENAQATWPLTVAAGLCSVTFGDPTVTDQSCNVFEEGETITGNIWVDFSDNLANEVNYQIVGGTYNYTATQETNNLPPGSYIVTVTAKNGFVLDQSKESVWNFTIDAAGTCSLVTHPLISTTASSTNTSCTASGTYTLANTEGVLWFVNGSKTPTAPGTYKVTGASTVNVEAQVVDDTFGWEDDAQTQWTFNFTNPADCLPTLAFTGASGGNLGLLLAGGLLLFGGTIIAVDRRRRVRSN